MQPITKKENFMRRLLVLPVLVLLASGLAKAQSGDTPPVEVFAGGGIMRNDAVTTNTLFGGLQFEGNYNFREHIGATADLSWEHRSIVGIGVSQWHYLFGPTFSSRRDRATLFAHALIGGNSFRTSGASVSGFALGFGGGVDYNATHHIAIRAFQLDYLPSRLSGTWFNDLRVGGGIVFKLGGR